MGKNKKGHETPIVSGLVLHTAAGEEEKGMDMLEYLRGVGLDVKKPLDIPKTPILSHYASLMAYV